jgi:predicted dinucleotide-binding enzyme
MEETLDAVGDLDGTVVVDVSFPHNKEQRASIRPRSTAEIIQRLRPNATVVKGWSHIFAQYLTAPQIDGIASSVLVAADDASAKDVAFTLARDMGFHPVDAGPLRAARDIERLVEVMLFVRLGPVRFLTQ